MTPHPSYPFYKTSEAMPRRAPVMRIVVSPRFRELRADRTLATVAAVSGVPAPILSAIERGERIPRPSEVAGLRLAYGDLDTWYLVELESTEEDTTP